MILRPEILVIAPLYFVKCPTKLSNNFTTKTYICLKFFGQSNIHVHKHETYLKLFSFGNAKEPVCN